MSIPSLEYQKQYKYPTQKSQVSIQNYSQDIIADEQQGPQESYLSRKCQRHLFETKCIQIEQGLNGDQSLSNNSIFIQNNNSISDNLQLNTESNIKQTTHPNKGRYEAQISEKHAIIEDSKNEQLSNFKNNQEQINVKNTKQNEYQIPKVSINSSKSIKKGIIEGQTISFDKSQSSIRDQIKKSDFNIDKQSQKGESRLEESWKNPSKYCGWIPEDIIYENNAYQLNKKVTLVAKNNFNSSQIQNPKERKYQQNFQKAAEIINRLLNTSMNRIMRVRHHVRNFIMLLKLRYLNRKINDLTDSDYMLINDLSNFYKSNKQKKNSKALMKHFNFIFKISKKIPIFMPTDTVRVIWDVILVLFTYIFLYFYSILMFFNQENPDTEFIKEFYFCTFFIFIIDVLVNFNTAFFNKDLIIISRKQIAKQYIFSTVFFTDFVSLLVLGIKVINRSHSIVYNPNHDLLTYCFNMLIFFKANGITQKKKRFDYVFTLKESEKHIIKLINQLFSVVTVAHIAAIGWYFLGILEVVNGNQLNWLEKLNLSEGAYYQKYIYSIYWSITTMTTAQEQKDRDKQAEDEIISILSNKLREEITIEINSKILNKFSIFSSNFSKQTLDKLVFKMTEVLINPNEIIFREEQNDDMSIYFIQSGVIEIYQQSVQKLDKPNVIKTLADESLFGEISFFSGLSRKASARSINLSTLYKISREDFLDVIQENNEDYERFKMIQEQIVFQGELSLLHVECYNCKKIGHISSQCPKTHQIFDKQFIILREIYSSFQHRSYFDRPIDKNDLKLLSLIQKNQNISMMIKQNLQDENTQIQLIFDSDHRYTGSSYYNSEDLEDDENEQCDEYATSSNSQTNFDNFSRKSSLNNQKNNQMQKKKTLKKKEASKKYLDSNQLCEDIGTILNSEQQFNSQNAITNTINDNLDFKKGYIQSFNIANSQKSLEDFEKLKSNQNIESNNNFVNSDMYHSKSQTQTKTDSDLYQQNMLCSQICKAEDLYEQEEEKEEEGQNNESQIIKKSKIQKYQELNLACIDSKHQIDYSKQHAKFQSMSGSNLQHLPIKRSSFKVQDELQLLINQNLKNQELHNNQSNKRVSALLLNQVSNSQNQIAKHNQEQINYRNYIDQILLQGILVNNLIQQNSSLNILPTDQSFKFLKKAEGDLEKKKNSIKQQNLVSNNNKSSILVTKEFIEEQPVYSYKNLSQAKTKYSVGKSSILNALSSINNNDINNGSKLFLQQSQTQNGQMGRSNELQMVDRLSKLLLNSQLPLLLKLTSGGMSFREMTSINSNNAMDMFDKMYNFKKFFPQNNIENVLNKLKQLQLELKKIKKQKQTNKPRRQNILFLRYYSNGSQVHDNLKLLQQEFHIDDYRPTYLSYGVSKRRGQQFPSNKHSLTLYF
ncbi:hypothetical protein ABPG72_014937 [Tetrahymena utriculariae]